MKKLSLASAIAAAAVALIPTMALANTSGTQAGVGPELNQAVANANSNVTKDCAAHGGVQSSQLVSYNNTGGDPWIAYVSYTCNS